MEQKSEEWFEARRGKLTGSEVGAALGVNPWKTPEALIRQMVRAYHGADTEFTGNIATEYGENHEPLALMDYLGKTGNLVEECGFFVHPEYSWIGATPDGIIDHDGMVEVKSPYSLRNKKGNDLVFKTAKVQPHYYAQMQVEMACSGREWVDFYQWAAHGDSIERVYWDQDWWDENLPKMIDFYNWYLSEINNPDHLEPKEREINTFHSQKLIQEWDHLTQLIDDSSSRKKEILSELVSIAKERNSVIHGRKLTKIERKGNVQYAKVPELKGVDLEPYRGKPSEFWKFS